MAEVAGRTQGKVKGNWSPPVPIVGHLELSAHHEIGEQLAPVGMRVERHPVTIIHFEADRRRLRRAGEFPISKGREELIAAIDQRKRLIVAIDQRLNERKALSYLERGPASFVVHD